MNKDDTSAEFSQEVKLAKVLECPNCGGKLFAVAPNEAIHEVAIICSCGHCHIVTAEAGFTINEGEGSTDIYASSRMIVGSNSPLRRIPHNLDRKQALFYDAIRFTIEMVDVAYKRLIHVLFTISKNDSFRQSHPMAVAFLDAWSIIDSVHRLRCLLQQLPGIKRSDLPERTVFLKRTDEVEDFRNNIQHLNNEMIRLAEKDDPAWGILSWFAITALYDQEEKRLPIQVKAGRYCLMISGSVVIGKPYKMAFPAEKSFADIVSLLTLQSGDMSLSFTKCFAAVDDFAHALEREMIKRFKSLPEARSDLYIIGNIDFQYESPDVSDKHD